MPQENVSQDVVGQSVGALENLWNQFVDYIPQLVGAALVLAIGWTIGTVIGRLLQRFLHYVGVDRWSSQTVNSTLDSVHSRLGRADEGRTTMVSDFAGSVVKWVIALVFLGVAADILNLQAVNEFLAAIIAYIPRAIVAVVILTIGFIASQFVGSLVGGSIAAADAPVRNRELISSVARWAVLVFAGMAALVQLGIVPQLIQILFAGLVLALAIAFGLGGRDHANDFIRSLRRQTQ